MKQYPKFGVLASAVLILTFVKAAQAQTHSPIGSSDSSDKSRAAIMCFSQIKDRVLEGNAQLKSDSAMLRSLDAQTRQAALPPNPVIIFEAENFGGDGSDNDVEYTGKISQLIETGAKRRHRTSLAKATTEAFGIRRDIATVELLANARVAYAEVIAAKSRLSLSEEEVAIRRKAQRLIARKSSHGGALRLEVERAKVSVQNAEIVHDQRMQELQVAKRTLSSLWGSDHSDMTFTNDELRIHAPEAELLATDTQPIPDVAYAKAMLETAMKYGELQRALAVPDVTISAGYRRFDATDNHAFVADVSMPLPLFDRNQFAAQGAEEQLRASQFDLANTRITVNAELESRRDQLRLLLRERKLLQRSVLPRTKRVLASATDAYRLGRISYLDYVDAQTTYLDRRERHVTVTLSAIRNQVEIQRLSGTLVERISQMDQGECNVQ